VGDGWTRQLWIEVGHVRAIVSDREEEKLGVWLVKRGRLEELPMALSLLQQPQGIRFGTFLVQQGLLTLESLETELQALAILILSRLLFAAGKFTFHEGEKVSNDSATLNMTTGTLLTNAVRVLENLARLEPLMRSNAFLWGAQDAFSVYQKAMLSPGESEILASITGATTVQDLRRRLTMPQDEFLRALGALIFAGFAVLRDRPAETQAPAPKVAPPPRPAVAEAIQFTARQEKERAMVIRVAAKIRQQNQYDRMQLNPGATQGQVYMRYRELAEVFHPDRASEPHLHGLENELAEIFACVEEAYEALGHEETRRAYDRREMMGWRPGSASTSSASGIPEDDEQGAQVQYVGSKEESLPGSLKRAKEMIAAGNTSGAIPVLDQAVRMNPDPATLLMLARLELKNPIWAQRAVDHLRHAVSLNSRLTEGWLELAAIWKSKNDLTRCRECLVRVLSYDATNREALEGLRGLK
jgi:hypothetical protein